YAAAGRSAAEIDEKEMVIVFFRQAEARIKRQPRRAVSEIGNGRDDVRGLPVVLRMPELLAVPGPAVRKVLVIHPPAALAPFDQIHPAGLVAAVGIVVAGKQVAELVEGQLLGIA